VPTDYNSRAVAAGLARRRHGGGMDVGRGSGQREAALQELHDRHASELWRFAMRRTHDRQLSEDICPRTTSYVVLRTT
jgi:hypothetical protein